MSGRNVFVFFDGTNCEISTNSNIVRLREVVSQRPTEFPYKEGPGRNFSWKALRNLNTLTGFDLDDTAKSAYRELLTWNLTRFDRLFVFGYSRGAITARILVQLITVRSVRDKFFAKGNLEQVLTVDVHFVGLFDPVIGWPFIFKRKNRERQLAKNGHVKSYVELMAMDERFALFPSHSGVVSPVSNKSRYTTKGAAMLTPDLSANAEVKQKRLGRRVFIWMPGEHADIGGQNGDQVIADHALLTMIEHMLNFSEDLNDPLFVNRELLADHLNSVGMDDEVSFGKFGIRRLLGWRRRKPTSGDGSVLHGFSKTLEGQEGVQKKFLRAKNRIYRIGEQFSDLPVEPSSYPKVRRSCEQS